MLKRFIDASDGQDLVEYALLVAIVAVGAIAALSGFQGVITTLWTNISNNLSGTG